MATFSQNPHPPSLPQPDRPSHWVDPTPWNGAQNRTAAGTENFGLSSALPDANDGQENTNAAQPGRLSPLPASHNELRQRLEDAGVPPSQIAAVLLQTDDSTAQPPSQTQTSPPTAAQSSPIPQSQDVQPVQAQSSTASQPQVAAAQLEPQSTPSVQSIPSQTPGSSISTSQSQQANDTPISFDICLSSKTKAGEHDCKNYSLVLSGDSVNNPSYTAVWRDVGSFSSAAQLHLYRNRDRSPHESARRQVMECRFHHYISEDVEIRHPWGHWGKWNPEKQTWQSDQGTLDGAWMKWEYGLPNPLNPMLKMLRRVTNGTDANDQPVEGLSGTETCRVLYINGETVCGRLEMPRALFEGAKEEELDEMVSNAMVQFFRFAKEWTSEDYDHSTEQALANANKLAGSLANFASATNASGGGGGGGA